MPGRLEPGSRNHERSADPGPTADDGRPEGKPRVRPTRHRADRSPTDPGPAPGSAAPGQAPPGRPPSGSQTPPEPPPRPGRRLHLLIPAAVIAFLLLAGAAFAIARAVAAANDDGIEVADVEFLSATDPGPAPFTIDVSTIHPDDRSVAASVVEPFDVDGSPDGAGLRVRPTSAADGRGPLYGARDESVCDARLLIDSLAADPEARAAWATLMGIDTSEVDETIAGLHPLLLTRDTAVTNSFFSTEGGHRFQTVLQAGTPVFVHPDGTPAVQCSCGNPLAPPEIDEDIEIDVEPWPGFDSRGIIEITPLPDGQVELPVVDVDTGEDETIEVGTSELIELDGYLVDDADGVHVVDEDGGHTTILDHPVAVVVDDGEGGILYQHVRSNTTDPTQTTRAVAPADEGEAVIWHLPAGEPDAVVYRESELGPRGWLALDGAGTDGDGNRMIAYLDVDGIPDCEAMGGDRPCLDFGEHRAWAEVVGGERSRVLEQTHVNSNEMSVGDGTVAIHYWHYEYHGLWSQRAFRSHEVEDSGHCSFECHEIYAGVVGSDRWLSATDPSGVSMEICQLTDASAPCEPVEGDLPASRRPEVTMTGERGILHLRDDVGGPIERTFVIDLRDEATETYREVDLGGRASILSAPIIRRRVS